MANCNNITKTEREALVRWNEFVDSSREVSIEEVFSKKELFEAELENLVEFGPKVAVLEILRCLESTIAEVMSLREGGSHA